MSDKADQNSAAVKLIGAERFVVVRVQLNAFALNLRSGFADRFPNCFTDATGNCFHFLFT